MPVSPARSRPAAAIDLGAFGGLRSQAVRFVELGATNCGHDDKVDLQQDCGSPCVQPVDSTGPAGFGFVNYDKNAAGDLRVVAVLKNAAPDTTYHVFLVCGPTHALVCAATFLDIGTLTTNGQGNGTTTISIESPPFVGGPDDHIDILKDVGDTSAGVYIATPIVNS